MSIKISAIIAILATLTIAARIPLKKNGDDEHNYTPAAYHSDYKYGKGYGYEHKKPSTLKKPVKKKNKKPKYYSLEQIRYGSKPPCTAAKFPSDACPGYVRDYYSERRCCQSRRNCHENCPEDTSSSSSTSNSSTSDSSSTSTSDSSSTSTSTSDSSSTSTSSSDSSSTSTSSSSSDDSSSSSSSSVDHHQRRRRTQNGPKSKRTVNNKKGSKKNYKSKKSNKKNSKKGKKSRKHH